MDEQFLRVLLVDDDETNVTRIRRITDAQRAPAMHVVQTCDLHETTAALADPGCDVVLLNLAACSDSALGVYAVIAAQAPDVPVLVMSPAAQETLALRAVQNGACDYLIVEQIYDTLLVRAIRHAIEQQRASQQRRQGEQALRASEARYRALFEQSRDAILIMDAKLVITEANRAATDLLGHPLEVLRGLAFGRLHNDATDGADVEQTLLDGGATGEIEVRLRRADGDAVWCLLSAAGRLDDSGTLVGYQGILHDITQRKHAEQRLIHDAFHDALTGLPNRARFVDRLDTALARWRRHSRNRFAVLFLDIDRFKVVNDSLGHSIGDEFLLHIARAVQDSIRAEDMVARLGGDEFVVLVDGVAEDADALRTSERIQRRLSQAFDIRGHRMFTSASIGIAFPEAPDQTAHDLLRNADIAMYRAKRTGPGQHQVFAAAMHSRALSQLELETDLRLAVARDEFVMHYQPIVELAEQRVIGFEALARWMHPTRGMLMPHDFIAVAEETGLIVQLGTLTLRQACAHGAAMMGRHPPDRMPFVAVNISARQLMMPSLVEEVVTTLAATGLPPHLLSLEITESALVSNAEAAADNIDRLRHLGIRICIDDFGTGYSSLSYLHSLPINGIKIDRSFISQLEADSDRLQVVRTIVELGRRLGMTVVAEGVESHDQLRHVEQLGVDAVQGFLFSRPLLGPTAAPLAARRLPARLGLPAGPH
ncbi:EAL domain-containing protein [soil metagenome]